MDGVSPTSDQRGFPRPAGGPIDIGAFQAQAPTAVADLFVTPAGQTLTVQAPGILANDMSVDPAYTTLRVLVFDPPMASTGALTVNQDGSFTFTPAAGFSGTATFRYALANDVRTSAFVTVTITVQPGAAPVATADSFTTAAGQTLAVAAPGVLANDTQGGSTGGTLTASLVAPPPASAGTLTLNSDGSFTFVPAVGFTGSATFQYAVSDGTLTSAPVTVTIAVTPSDTSVVVTPPIGYAAGTGTDGGPRVRVFGPDGAIIQDFFAFEESFRNGVRVAVADIDGDGNLDVIAVPGFGGGPRVRVFGGGDPNNVIADFFVFEPELRTGLFVAAGDLDGDGKADIVIGAGSSDPSSPIPGTVSGPRVLVVSGATLNPGNPLASFFAYTPNFSGGVRVAVGDVNGDGFADLITSAGPSGGPQINVYFGGSDLSGLGRGQPDVNFMAFDSNYRGGAFVSVIDGSIAVTPDSFPQFAGSFLDTQFGTLVNTDGTSRGAGQLGSSPDLVAPAIVYLFDLAGARVNTPNQAIPVLDGALSGARTSPGRYNGDTGLYVGAGPGQGTRVQFFPLDDTGRLSATPTLDTPAYDDPLALFSVYVGGSEIPAGV